MNTRDLLKEEEEKGHIIKRLYYPTSKGEIPERFPTILHFYLHFLNCIKEINWNESFRTFQILIREDKSQPYIEVYDISEVRALCINYILSNLPIFEDYLDMKEESLRRHEAISEKDKNFLSILRTIDRFTATS